MQRADHEHTIWSVFWKSRKMCFSVCGEFIQDLWGIAGYSAEIWDEFSANGKADCGNGFSNMLWKERLQNYGNNTEDETDFSGIAARALCCFRKVSCRTGRGQQADRAERTGIGKCISESIRADIWVKNRRRHLDCRQWGRKEKAAGLLQYAERLWCRQPGRTQKASDSADFKRKRASKALLLQQPVRCQWSNCQLRFRSGRRMARTVRAACKPQAGQRHFDWGQWR